MKLGQSRLYEERGLHFLSAQDVPRAIEAFEQAVSINPALSTSWIALEHLYRVTGDVKKAAYAARHYATLKRLPAQIVQAGSLFSEGELALAENVLRSYLRTSDHQLEPQPVLGRVEPHGVAPRAEALRMLGRIRHLRNDLGEADRLLEEVLTLAPEYRAARADYARVLIDLQRYVEARDVIGGLLSLESGNRDWLTLDATVSAGLGEHERAILLYRELLATVSSGAHLHVLLGNSLKAVGRQHEAVDSYRTAAVIRPDFGDAYWSLANLKTHRFGAEEIERMRRMEAASSTQPVDRWHLCFALGKALEDQADYAASWSYYERGNELKRAQCGYDPALTETSVRQQLEVFTAEFFAEHSGQGMLSAGAPIADVSTAARCAPQTPAPVPIFILGLPRSGSTLVEQILASHSQVEGTQELHEVERIARELHGAAELTRLGTGDFRKLGERYLSDTQPYRKGKALFIDKMPNNFRHIGLIHLMLPDAKIIDVRREPMACCFSNLKQLFAGGQAFTYSIECMARYYRSYLELMRHWDAVLPGRVLRVSYEDLVEDTETNVRCMLQFCGLQFEQSCVEFYNTARNINTASSEQVRQPVFRSALSHWRHYEPWLEPLKVALGDALIRYRD